MFSPFLILLLVVLVALLVIGYRRPSSLAAPSFAFTRSCLGITLFCYAVSPISGYLPTAEAGTALSIIRARLSTSTRGNPRQISVPGAAKLSSRHDRCWIASLIKLPLDKALGHSD